MQQIYDLQILSFSFFSISTLCLLTLMYIPLQSCRKDTLPTICSTTNPAPNSQKRILSLCDSYTIGASVTQSERFQNKTIFILTTSGINLKYPSQIIAITGWTTQNFLNDLAISGNLLSPPYDIVTILIVVNINLNGQILLCIE